MLNGLLSIIQMLWCFMGESILGEQTTKDWILNHKVTIFRYVATLIVLCCFLFVIDYETVLMANNAKLKTDYIVIQNENETLKKINQQLLTNSNVILKSNCDTVKENNNVNLIKGL